VGEKGGGRRSWSPLSHLQQASVLGGGGKGEREQNRPCTRCSLHACSFTLCLSFAYLRSAVEASFDTKKACGSRTPFNPNIFILLGLELQAKMCWKNSTAIKYFFLLKGMVFIKKRRAVSPIVG
jgi:hypothetical protein